MKIHPIEWLLIVAVVGLIVALVIGVRRSSEHADACRAAGGAWMAREMVCLSPNHHQPYHLEAK